MAGTKNDVLVGKNADFTQANAPNGQSSEANGLVTNGQLWIGSTALNAGATHINVGTLTSPDASITIGYSSPNITLSGFSLSDDLYTAKWIVNPTPGMGGNQTTIQGAIDDAVSGETIAIFPGTYTENLTLKAGVNLTTWGSDASQNGTGHVIINGTCTFTAAGTVSIFGIQLQTNSAPLLTVSGSAASVVNLNNCYLNCTNNTGISYTSSSSSSSINLNNCRGNLGTTGIALFASTSAGAITIYRTNLSNLGNSTTNSTISSGFIFIQYSSLTHAITTSSTAGIIADYSTLSTTGLNITSLTHGGTGTSSVQFCGLGGGTATALTIGAGATVRVINTHINSSNAVAISGDGTINCANLTFINTSSIITVTTQNKLIVGPAATFLAQGGTQTNVTGDGTAYTVTFGTEIYDPGNNFSSPTFTAPITGRYLFTVLVYQTGLTTSHTTGEISLITTARSYSLAAGNFGAMMTASSTLRFGGLSQIADMTKGDTATVLLTISNGTKVVDLTNAQSYFGATLLN